MVLDPAGCYRALLARDARFDGVFFVAVSTTGIYCRPVCPARTPRQDRCRFFSRAAEAEREGYRACFRCRPELAPGLAPMDSMSRIARDALARISSGYLDTRSVDALASELGVSARHLRRATEEELGVAPIELAQSRRVALARKLLSETSLPITRVAFACGFGSLRRMNASFAERAGKAPRAFRQVTSRHTKGNTSGHEEGGVSLRLEYRPPYAWEPMLRFLRARTITGVEVVDDAAYTRTLRSGDERGWLRVSQAKARDALLVFVSSSLVSRLGAIVPRVRALFDLDARPVEIDRALGRDALLRPHVRAMPGLRVPGAIEGDELAFRAVLGQQISVAGATTIAGRLAAALGEEVPDAPASLTHTFPDAAAVAGAGTERLQALGLTRARAATLVLLAEALADGRVCLARGADAAHASGALQAIRGVGPWTAELCAMRALGWPDSFLAGDLGVRKAMDLGTEREVLAHAEAWRPWRSYAVMHLWMQGGAER